jgi:BirA family biotin operon repressor/biotin-[acetyl-CoA-carboxylase] ligase
VTSSANEPSPYVWPDGWHVEWVAETGSTNADLLVAGSAGAPDRTVLAADLQTAGRGRFDRRWDAPTGTNLLVSLLLRDVPQQPHELTQRVALAALVAVKRVAGVDAVLKWPNDVLVDEAKLAGILAQTGPSPTDPRGPKAFVVVGIGVNIGWAPEGAARLGTGVERRQVLAELLIAFDELPVDVSALYREHLATIGQEVRVEFGDDRVLVGRAIGVETDGRLIVLDECATTHRIDSGDVVHLRPAPS